MCDALRDRGLSVAVAAIDRRASGPLRTPSKYAALARRAVRDARGADVIYAHFLFPTGAIAASASRRARIPYVVTAHGQDVRNLERRAAAPRHPGGPAGRERGHRGERLPRRESCAAAGIALPPVHVVNMGVDLDRFAPSDRGGGAGAPRARRRTDRWWSPSAA